MDVALFSDAGVQEFLVAQVPRGLLALGLVVVLMPLYRWVARRVGLVDVPAGRKQHVAPVARVGGMGLVDAFLLVFLVFGLWDWFSWGVWLGLGVLLLVGVWDDVVSLSAKWQLLGQVIGCSLTVFVGGVRIDFFQNPVGEGLVLLPAVLGSIVSLFWLLLLINAINWADGLDGLAGGMVLIGSVVLALLSLQVGQFEVVALLVVFVPLLVGFLVFNLPPASVFLGTVGVYFLGFMFGVLSIEGGAKVATSVVVLSFPIIDVVMTIMRRLQQGKKIYLPDREHLFLRLRDSGLSQWQVLGLFYTTTAVLGCVSLFSSTVVKVMLLVVAFCLIIVMHGWVSWTRKLKN